MEISVTSCSPRSSRILDSSEASLVTFLGAFYPEQTAEYPDGRISLRTGSVRTGMTAVAETAVWDPDALMCPGLSPEEILIAREEDDHEEDKEILCGDGRIVCFRDLPIEDAEARNRPIRLTRVVVQAA
ncbi:MAG: hypothetical protein ABIB04_02360 [Patescibacteria group bacterium]